MGRDANFFDGTGPKPPSGEGFRDITVEEGLSGGMELLDVRDRSIGPDREEEDANLEMPHDIGRHWRRPWRVENQRDEVG
jgi:hypothetical protein